MVEEEGSIGTDSTGGLDLEAERAAVFLMSRQEVIDALSGNRRRTTNRAGQVITIIERIDRPTGSGEDADLFTPPDASPRGIEPPSHP